MILLDSNILIYSAQAPYAHLRALVGNPSHQVSAFTVLEVLGYPALTPTDKNYFTSVFEILEVNPITDRIIDKAISLRQIRRTSAGDAIIAATALEYGYELYTRNVDDFNWIKGLKVINPV